MSSTLEYGVSLLTVKKFRSSRYHSSKNDARVVSQSDTDKDKRGERDLIRSHKTVKRMQQVIPIKQY